MLKHLNITSEQAQRLLDAKLTTSKRLTKYLKKVITPPTEAKLKKEKKKIKKEKKKEQKPARTARTAQPASRNLGRNRMTQRFRGLTVTRRRSGIVASSSRRRSIRK
jgi:hypothetical protein